MYPCWSMMGRSSRDERAGVAEEVEVGDGDASAAAEMSRRHWFFWVLPSRAAAAVLAGDDRADADDGDDAPLLRAAAAARPSKRDAETAFVIFLFIVDVGIRLEEAAAAGVVEEDDSRESEVPPSILCGSKCL